MNKFKKYNKGILIIEVNSFSPEKFINALWKNGISTKNINKQNVSTITMEVNLKDFYEIEKLAQISKTKIRILNRKGISFLRIKYKNRKAFFIGIVLFVAVIYYLSTFIWDINIVTESNVSPYEIRKQLKSYGVKPGINKGDLNLLQIEGKLQMDNDEIAWARVRIEGSSLNVKIAERQSPPSIVEDDSPCDLVASRDGEILRIYTKAGTPLAVEGDIVKKGEIVVKGMQGNEENSYYVHAEGKVIAKTFYEKIKTVQLNKKERRRTGKSMKNTYIEIKGKRIYLKNGLNKFTNYDKIEERKSFFKSEVYYEVEEKENIIDDVDKAIEDTINELYSEIIIDLDKSVKIVDEIKDVQKNEDNFRVRLVVIVEEDIALPQRIKKTEMLD